MTSLNQVNLIGNLTRDPALRQLSNAQIAEFGLAMNHRYRTKDGEQREEVTFVDCTAFGKQAEVVSQYARKGARLYVGGRLKLDTWDDKNGGGRRHKLYVVVENFQFLDAPQQQREQGQQADAAQGHDDIPF